MSEQQLALSTVPRPQPAAGEYEAICETVKESARGRWFLDEYARRNRSADTALVLAAIERVEAAVRAGPGREPYRSIRGDLLEMARTIAQTRAEVAEPEARRVAAASAAQSLPASLDIHVTAERIQDVTWTLRERGIDARTCGEIEALASTILSASSLRDPDDHRTRKLREVLHDLERRIDAMLAACVETAEHSAPDASTAQAPAQLASAPRAVREQPAEAEPVVASDMNGGQAPRDGNGQDLQASHAAAGREAAPPAEKAAPEAAPIPAAEMPATAPLTEPAAVAPPAQPAEQASAQAPPAQFRPPEAAVLYVVECAKPAPEPAQIRPQPASEHSGELQSEPAAADGPADFLLEPLPPPDCASLPLPPAPAAAAMAPSAGEIAEFEADLFLSPPPVAAVAAEAAAPDPEPADPFAALRAMSDEERIALFS